MFTTLNLISAEIVQSLSRLVTGKLLTERQIRGVTENVIGKHFIGFFPPPVEEVEAKRRVELAREHISAASTIILKLQHDLASQADELEKIAKEIEEKRSIADRYAALASANQRMVQAFRVEMEEAIREELVAQAKKGQGIRRALAFTGWLLTLILGAALGTYFEEAVEFLRALIA